MGLQVWQLGARGRFECNCRKREGEGRSAYQLLNDHVTEGSREQYRSWYNPHVIVEPHRIYLSKPPPIIIYTNPCMTKQVSSDTKINLQQVPTKPIDGQKPGTSGLRKTVKTFKEPHYV